MVLAAACAFWFTVVATAAVVAGWPGAVAVALYAAAAVCAGVARVIARRIARAGQTLTAHRS